MKELLEYKNYLIKYLSKKDVILITPSDNSYYLIWNYNVHYSKFEIKLYFDKRKYDDEFFIIKYNVNCYSIKTSRRKTSTKGNFGAVVYKNLQYIKDNLDKNALENKNKIDTKKKFCTELESYYKRSYKSVTISTEQYDDRILINIFAYNDNNMSVNYNILYYNSKYYLQSKFENFGRNSDTFFSVKL